MDYCGYKISRDDNALIIENIRDFDPVHVFECGQCFRWIKQSDSSYTGVVKGKIANMKYTDGVLVIKGTTEEEFENLWFDYLDLGRDYSRIKEILSSKDEVMKRAVDFGYGIRLLRQDIWETLISFIISANNRIPMIMKTVAAMSQVYGEGLRFDGKAYYSFPSADRLAESNVEELEVCRGGFRCKYIINTSVMVKGGVVKLQRLEGMDSDEARKELTKLPGVGNKVADCTLLYSGTKYDVFPTDVWVKRVMEELYFKREASFKEIQDFAADYFGEHAGLAQQYLFYYARENRIGAK